VAQSFVPLAFPPGETCQFDWSHEEVELRGTPQTVKVARFLLAFQPRMFVAAYPRETQEMVFDAHARAFAFFGGAPTRLVYDNLKTVVDLGITGKGGGGPRPCTCTAWPPPGPSTRPRPPRAP